MKPIGQGETDQFKKNTALNKLQNKEYLGVSFENHSITFKSLKGKGEVKEYKFPDVVITDDFDNKLLYD